MIKSIYTQTLKHVWSAAKFVATYRVCALELALSVVVALRCMEGQDNLGTALRWRDAWRQILASCISYLIVTQTGACMAFSGVLIPELTANGSEMAVSADQASWIASLVTLFLPVGALSAGPLMDRFGRKRLCLFNCIPFLLTWLLIIAADRVYLIYIARVLAGIASGWTSVSLVYVSEISHPSFRAMLLSFNSVFFSLGILIVCILGTCMSWRLLSIAFAVLTAVSALLLLLIPESPHWLVTFGRLDRAAATKSLHWLYEEDKQLCEEQLTQVLRSRPDAATMAEEEEEEEHSYKATDICTNPNVFKPTVSLLIIFLLQQCSGSYVMIFYIIDIFQKVGNHLETNFNEYTCLVLLGVIRFLMSIVSSVVSKRVGRKALMYLSCAGMILSSIAVIVRKSFFDAPNDLLSAVFVLVYVAFASLGVLVIPWTLVTEILPIKLKGKLGGVLITYTYLAMFVLVKVFPEAMSTVHMQHIFAFFGFNCLLLIIFIAIYLPETFAKTFVEIETFYTKNRMFCR